MGARRRGSEEAQGFWAVDSTPFAADPPPAQPCRIVLRQVSDNEFALQERADLAFRRLLTDSGGSRQPSGSPGGHGSSRPGLSRSWTRAAGVWRPNRRANQPR